MQHAVDPIADLQPGALRLDMHVARTEFDRLEQDLVDQPNDRRLLGHLGELGPVGLDLLEQLDPLVLGLGQ